MKGQASKNARSVEIWLWSICLLTLAMVGVGGITRLTGSGLSMVEWNPIMGAIPPLSSEHWMRVFQKYQATPQFKWVNPTITLSGFKLIFFWEWFHRLLGRFIGLFYLGPWGYFAAKNLIPTGLRRTLVAGLVLGLNQAVMGWMMVKSGLVDQPHVSHYRLAAHLFLALAIMGTFCWAALNLRAVRLNRVIKAQFSFVPFSRILSVVGVLVLVQIFYGALTAGLRAGFIFNTFPKMGSEWLPDSVLMLSPFWRNFLENLAGVQFCHRVFGWSLLCSALGVFFYSRRLPLSPGQRVTIRCFTCGVLLQFLLGVLTLILAVPLPLAVMHQVVGSITFLLLLWARHSVKDNLG